MNLLEDCKDFVNPHYWKLGRKIKQPKRPASNNFLSDIDLNGTNNMMEKKSKLPKLTGLTVGEAT